MRANWVLPKPATEAVSELVGALRVHPLAASVLVNRGLSDPESARRFLRPSLQELCDPYLLSGMREAVSRVKQAIDRREPILIYGDYDVDGITSVVILKKAIELAGGAASFHIPHRLRDGYGLNAAAIEQAASAGARLLITVDTGIRSAEIVRATQSLGLDVIVTDHHLPDADIPPAYAVLNPNLPGSTYPEKNLCGAGVAFKLVQALLGSLGWTAARLDRMLQSFLKLVAIATVADVVPLLGENRIIVKHGLDGLVQVKNHGLRALMEVSRLLDGSAPSAHEVAFQIAPRINAAGRMANAEDVVRLFLTEDADEARSIAQQLHALNQDRQQTEAAIVASILEECAQSPVTNEQYVLVFSSPGWHRGVVGIVASRLVERYCRPVFVLCEEGPLAQGSGRSIPPYHLLEGLESVAHLFTRFGGHRQAAGLALRIENLAEFRRLLNLHASARLTPANFRPMLSIDAVARFGDLNDETFEELQALAPFGFGNPGPLLAAFEAEVCAPPTIFKDKHLRVHLRQNGRAITATAWNFADRAVECARGCKLDVAFCLEEDSYSESRGWGVWRATVRDVRAALTEV